jgi:hypothetical protein
LIALQTIAPSADCARPDGLPEYRDVSEAGLDDATRQRPEIRQKQGVGAAGKETASLLPALASAPDACARVPLPGAPAVDDTQSSASMPNSRLLSADERACVRTPVAVPLWDVAPSITSDSAEASTFGGCERVGD